ncbi:tetratricopeptide repeat protein [Mucilaginibacter sp. RS28]|uniref:histidine kinase n=1 Tax=Mucilaginibacter straminoryzae TaxID=2932774 RepID=A0A9X2B856_9SPHI|nr:histidine kinase dimerization/phosphoacceptor domain -containing protein [Mucilaginibacter straminoryzae]MCJ8208365.1 tetratricopeptide repeat protein [Mucilaginibacter straminoryzae]
MTLRNLSARLILLLLLAPATTLANRHDQIPDLRKKIKAATSDQEKLDLNLRLGEQYLTKPGELKNDLDSAMYFQNLALQLSKSTGDESMQAKAILLKGRIQLEAGDRAKASASVKEALDFSIKRKLKYDEAKAYETQLQFFDNENEGLKAKMALEKKAIALFHEIGAVEEEATGLKFLGDYDHMLGKGEEALSYLQQAMALYQKIHFREMQGVYNLISNVYMQMGNYPLSIRYGFMAAKNAEELGDYSLQLSSIYNHLAMTYYFLKQDKQALDTWNKALDVARRYNDPGYMQTILANMATSYVRLKKYNEALKALDEIRLKYPPTEIQMKLRVPYIYFNTYMEMGKLDKAAPIFNTLMDYHQKLAGDDPNQTYLYTGIIRYLIATKRYKEVYPYLQKSVEFDAGNNLFLSRTELQWYKADSATNNLASAIKHYKLYKTYSDSVFNADKANQISYLQIQFETAQKDKNILLLKQKNGLQAETIKKDGTIKAIVAACAFLLFVLLAVIYNRYRLKQRSHAQLQQQQQEINKQNELLRKLLQEKDWLLKEIHHRVKNNLQIVISLLNTQSAYINNQDAMDAIQNSQHRMHAMSLIHQKLYQSDNLATIDLSWYIQELVSYMKECFEVNNINFNVVAEPLCLDVAQAVPLGLILNESVTNSIKYAFPQGRKGTVSIILEAVGDGHYTLVISDNGTGLPAGFDEYENSSLGMNLMRGLTDQLEGSFELINQNGLTIKITFEARSAMAVLQSA